MALFFLCRRRDCPPHREHEQAEMFDGNPITQQIALALNLLPGALAQLPQRAVIGHGGGWIESLHSGHCQEVDRHLRDLGFQPIGPLSCKLMPGWVLRGFSHPQADAWAVHYQGIFFGSQVDLVSEFVDGSWLTTTSHALAGSLDPERKRLHILLGRSLEEMWQSHQGRVQQCQEATMLTGGQRELADSIRRYFQLKPARRRGQ